MFYLFAGFIVFSQVSALGCDHDGFCSISHMIMRMSSSLSVLYCFMLYIFSSISYLIHFALVSSILSSE